MDSQFFPFKLYLEYVNLKFEFIELSGPYNIEMGTNLLYVSNLTLCVPSNFGVFS